ncbi:hypothetical protein WG68_08545 [Arsukibacterium ikkense]|uniref:Type I restriction modification DNA specificity domain-containing protein n=1 Tax=Arsukibacterium ikkense TaxID=336831 RepID=A0A0M2V7X7_9GAMM|nr:restriction endonuclease subunit S [Arsukibacterium ikkense]KKO45755.1 hypothetical protein WG68_08545 [Arsukibacterium ikkense]
MAVQVEKLITEHLDLWTQAQTAKSTSGRGSNNKIELTGIKKLRELILELAVRGKLVPQDPNDEPASELLKRIAAEKEALVKAGKLKKQKPLPPISNEEKPFELPVGWKWARIGEIGNVFNGNSINASQKESEYTGLSNGYPYVATKDVGYGFTELDYDNGVLIPKNIEKFKVAHKGAVLICAEGGSAGKKCGITNRDICFGNKLYANELFCGISPKFVLSWYLTPTLFSILSESMTGIIGGISTAKFCELVIPLPPISYQNRLIERIDNLIELCDQLEQQSYQQLDAHNQLVDALLATLTQSLNADELASNWQRLAAHFDTLFTTEYSINALKQSILQLAVMGKLCKQDPNDEPASELLKRIAYEKDALVKAGKIKKQKALPHITDDEKPFELPDGWEWVRCSDICFKITDGEHATPRRSEIGHYLLSARNVTNQGIVLHDVDFVPADEFERIRRRCDPNIGDILISCSGSIGRVALVDKSDTYSMVRSAAMIRPATTLNIDYLAMMLRSPFLQIQMTNKSKQSAQANLFLGAISQLVAIIPPVNEQARIISRVNEIFKISGLLCCQLASTKNTQAVLAEVLVEQAVP